MSNLEQWKKDPLYRNLTSVFSSDEGNLLELTLPETAQAQVDFIRYLLLKSRPHKILETGTNKALFGFALYRLIQEEGLPPVKLYTFDMNEKSAECVDWLNRSQPYVRATFTHGDTQQTLKHFGKWGIGLAWIDGGHDYLTAYNDMKHAVRLGIPYIAVDDVKAFPHLPHAITRILEEFPEYRQHPNPFYDRDSRGAMLLTRNKRMFEW